MSDDDFRKQPRFIAVEGPIGVGKTSLARRLAESLNGDLMLEEPHENPFLERFYKDPRSNALPTQLHFLFQRARQIERLRQADMFQPVRVADFMLQKDRIFAEINLDQDELRLYEEICSKLALETPEPDLVVYLQAPVDVLLQRIAKRGIDYEYRIERDYLERLMEAYARFFHEYDASPLLIVNAAGIDLVNYEQDYQQLFSRIADVQRGRHFFNPAAHTIL